jgi:hypothetical protein
MNERYEADSAGKAERVAATADRLRMDAATAEVLRAFSASGVRSLLLKGPALTGWIYPRDEPRSYMDVDLWIRPGDERAAEAILVQLQFSKLLDDSGLPEWWEDHGSHWTRDIDAVVVDLHRTLPGLGVSPERAWDVLSRDTETITVAHERVGIMSAPARAMHVAMHAAHHGEAWGKALIHLERALSALDDTVWIAAAELAEQLAADDQFAAGLRLVDGGSELADRLGLGATRSVRVSLQATTPPPVALGFEQLAQAGGIRARAAIVARKAVPPPGFIRHWWPPAARNRRMLVLGYMYRPLWLLQHAPAGLRAWRAARRRVRAGRG